jgi:hypothetical protein
MFGINDRPGYADYSDARHLIENGELSREFTSVSGATAAGQLVRAIIGNNRETYERALEAPDPMRIVLYDHKHIARHKLSKIQKQDARQHKVTTVSMDDPYILPRYMKAKDYVNFYSAVAFANSFERGGRLFNVQLNINWGQLGFPAGLDDGPLLYEKFIKQFTVWCLDQDIDCLWLYSNEYSPRVGLHTHFMTAIDGDRLPAFQAYVKARLHKIAPDKNYPKTAYKSSDLKEQSMADQWRRLQYLCKGVDPHATLTHMSGKKVLVMDLIKSPHENPGNFSRWKRCGVSPNIGQAERKARGFVSALEKGIMNIDYLYDPDKPLAVGVDPDIDARLQNLNL